MKKIIYSLLFLIFSFLPINVIAQGYINVSSDSITVTKGSTTAFTITAFNAIGDVTISSNDTNIATVNKSEWETGIVGENETKSGEIIVTGINTGTTTLTIKIDGATFDEEDLSGQTKTITINVIENGQETIPDTPTNIENNNNNVNNNNNSNNIQKPQITNNKNVGNATNNKSTNNNLKSLTVDNYELKKVDDHNYTLIVSNNVTFININAIAEDEKASIIGNGEHQLSIGENNIEVVITSESGIQNKINILITRKDGYYLEDLDYILNNDVSNNIIIDKDTKITNKDILKIKNSKKTINFNYYDDNKKLIYSWILDGNKIKNSNGFLTTILNDSKYKENIYKLSNYADGLYFSLKLNKILPEGTKLKLYVGNKYTDENNINIYCYNINNNKLNLIDNVKVKNGYIEFSSSEYSEYFLTLSNIKNINKEGISENIDTNTFIIIGIIIVIILCIIILIIYIVSTNKKNKYKIIDMTNIDFNKPNK